jgi:hypothetical protein
MKAKFIREGLDFERSGDPRKSLGFGKIHLEHFENVIITALEGGSNYWYMLYTEDYKPFLIPKTPQKPALSERIAGTLYSNPKFELPVYDAENPEELLGKVTQASMFKAFQIAEKDYFFVWKHLMENTEDFDATDADIVFQLATMGEVRFG